MKYVLAALLLALGLMPIAASADSKSASNPQTFPLTYYITDNHKILTTYRGAVDADNAVIKVAKPGYGWFRTRAGLARFSVTPGGSPMAYDPGSIIPDTANMVASINPSDLQGAGTAGMLYNNHSALYITPDPSGGSLPVSITGTFNSTAPSLSTGQTVGLQMDASGALLVATGKTYISLAAGGAGCTNLFSSPIRLVTVDNPGIAQTNPFGLYDDAGGCAGFAFFGQAIASGATGPVMGPAQTITISVRTTTGLSVDWYTGGNATGSVPYITVQ